MSSDPWNDAVGQLMNVLTHDQQVELAQMISDPIFPQLVAISAQGLEIAVGRREAQKKTTGARYEMSDRTFEAYRDQLTQIFLAVVVEQGAIEPARRERLIRACHHAFHASRHALLWSELTPREQDCVIPAAMASLGGWTRGDSPDVPEDTRPLPDTLNFIIWYCRLYGTATDTHPNA